MERVLGSLGIVFIIFWSESIFAKDEKIAKSSIEINKSILDYLQNRLENLTTITKIHEGLWLAGTILNPNEEERNKELTKRISILSKCVEFPKMLASRLKKAKFKSVEGSSECLVSIRCPQTRLSIFDSSVSKTGGLDSFQQPPEAKTLKPGVALGSATCMTQNERYMEAVAETLYIVGVKGDTIETGIVTDKRTIALKSLNFTEMPPMILGRVWIKPDLAEKAEGYRSLLFIFMNDKNKPYGYIEKKLEDDLRADEAYSFTIDLSKISRNIEEKRPDVFNIKVRLSQDIKDKDDQPGDILGTIQAVKADQKDINITLDSLKSP